MGANPAPTNDNGQAALLALSNALTVLASRLRAGAVAADDFERLKARAAAIAAQAWDLRTTRWAFVENAAKLANDLAAFAEETRAASARAAATVSGNVAVIETLEAHAARIATLHVDGGTESVSRRQAIRAELQPLEATMVAFRARLVIEHRTSEEAKALATRASGLAECALSLRGGGRSAEAAAEEVHKALSTFVADASAAAQRIALAATDTGMAAAHLAPELSMMAASKGGRPPVGGGRTPPRETGLGQSRASAPCRAGGLQW